MKITLILLAACSAPADHRLPGASITPRLAARVEPRACGQDVAFGEVAQPVIRYRYDYDAHGRLALATGTFATGGPDDVISYAYDHLGHATQITESRASDNSRIEVIAEYDTLGDLVDYTWLVGSDAQRYVFSAFSAAGQPTHEQFSMTGQVDVLSRLDYDAFDRVVSITPDQGPPTLYAYDDDAHTTTIDSGQGAFHGVQLYDDRARLIRETWDGSAPSAIASDTRYVRADERLLSVTYRSGSSEAPHQLATVEVDTYRYDCR